MTNLYGAQPWLFHGTPSLINIIVSHLLSENCRNLRWTLPITTRVNPLKHISFLNVRMSLIHPAPSRSAALDHHPWNCIFSAERLNICPVGISERDIPAMMVERYRFDGACKARFAYRWRTLQLFIAWAIQSLHGSFDFRWGEKPSRIFEKLSQFKNQTTHDALGRIHSFVSLGRNIRPKITPRLNALRVAERNLP